VNLSDERIALTGANGWLGRETAFRLIQENPSQPLLALGRNPALLELPGCEPIPVHQWANTDVADWEPTVLIHLAALTKERLRGMALQAYIDENDALTQSALAISRLRSIHSVVTASSGAAISQLDHPYGAHKASEEALFRKSATEENKNLVVARIWSVSGRFCTKPEEFLFFDLLRQAVGDSEFIEVLAENRVYRRYVDGGEFLEICLRAALSGHSGTIDSTGEVVEAGVLAECINSVLRANKRVRRAPERNGPDEYLSQSAAMEKWARATGVQVSDLSHQIVRSLEAIRPMEGL